MHTAEALISDPLTIQIAGRPAEIPELFPGFDETDRIGLVLTTPHGALGASLLYLTAVHAFYDLQRQKADDFWIYPDFYFFHVGARFGHHGSLDVWPDHKEVEIEAEPDRVLEAINDRAITRLLVPDNPFSEPPSRREALASYRSRIRGAFAYSPTGTVTDADVVVTGNETTEAWVHDALDPTGLIERLGPGEEATTVRAHMDEVAPETLTAIALRRRELVKNGRPHEAYRRIVPEDALARLASPAS